MGALREPELLKLKVRIPQNMVLYFKSATTLLSNLCYNCVENVNDFLEGIKWQEVKKEYLTLDEMKILDATECDVPVLKQASMFGLFTGLRLSDLLQLRWENIEQSPDGGYCGKSRAD